MNSSNRTFYTPIHKPEEGQTGANIPGLIGVLIFYWIVFSVGLLAARWKTRRQWRKKEETHTRTVILAGRNIGLCVGFFSMTATWVGGGYINGTAEKLYASGLVWCQAPFGYALSLFIGTTIATVLNVEIAFGVIMSTLIAVGYTFFGGMYSVAYTDILQLTLVLVGLAVSIPFMYYSDYVIPSFTKTHPTVWIGSLAVDDLGEFIDVYLVLICGGIPWQVYFQRVLAAKSPEYAQLISYTGAVGCLAMSLPPALIGIIARGADWDAAGYNSTVHGKMKDNPGMVLPAAIEYLTPNWVAFFGLGAVSAAVMSSADSSILSISSMFAHNIYHKVFRPNAEDREVMWVLRTTMVLNGVLACLIGLLVKSIYSLFYICSDLVYVMLFPQLVCVIYVPFVNSYGVLCGTILGFFFRLSAGAPEFGFEAIVKYPGYSYKAGKQRFPLRTLAMTVNFFSTLLISHMTNFYFGKSKTVGKYDPVNKAPAATITKRKHSKQRRSVTIEDFPGKKSLSGKTISSSSTTKTETAK